MKNIKSKMSSKSKVSISVCLLLAVSICIYAQVPVVHSWSSEAHQSITSTAIDLMPVDWDWFFQTYSSTIVSYCTKPDSWKFNGSSGYPMEGYRHYDDTDIPHGAGAVLSPVNYLGKEIRVYQEGAIPGYTYGILPWTLVDNFNMFVVCLEENDWTHAAQLAGVISHYIGDASNPLHATSDYSPGGNHGAYEGAVDSHLDDEINMIISGFVPHEIDNVFDSTMQLLDEGYGYTGRDTENQLNYWLAQDIIWNDTIKGITENRLRTGAQLLANLWYTAFVQAGISSTSSSPPPSATPINYTPYVVGGVLAIVVISIVLVLYMRRR